MHEDCQILAEALIAATEAIKASNESIKTSRDRERETAVKLYNLNSKLILAIMVVAAIIVIGFVARDYIQYSTSYDNGISQTQTTITGSNNEVGKGDVNNGETTKTTETTENTKETKVNEVQ